MDAADPQQMHGYTYGNNNPLIYADPTGLAFEECVSGQYKCTYGKSTGDIKKVSFGNNYKQVTRANGGTISRNYYAQKVTGRKYTYTKGKGISTRYTHSEYRRADAAAQKARDAAAQKARDAERTRQDQITKNTQDTRSNWQKFKDGAKGAWDKLTSFSSTSGLCISIGGAIAFGYEATGCLIRTRRPDGKSDYGLSGTFEHQVGASAGLGVSAQEMFSNADDFDQIRGESAGVAGSAGLGWGVTGSHRGTFGTRNSRGDIVHSFTGTVWYPASRGTSDPERQEFTSSSRGSGRCKQAQLVRSR